MTKTKLQPSGFGGAIVVVVAFTIVTRLIFGVSESQLADVVMIYLLGIVLVSLRWGLWPSLLAAILSIFALDFFFIPPFHTFAVSNIRHIATFVVMFVVAVVISGLNKRVRDQSIERERLADRERQAQLRVEAEQLRNSLLSSVSHDLRTPLAIITGTASTLLEDKVEPHVRRELTEGIVEEADRLNRLVRNLLDMTRLEAGAIKVNKEWQSIEEAIGVALDRVERAIGKRKITTDVPADLPLVPEYDSILLQQVLVNLLENAAKYTPVDTEIAIQAFRRRGNGKEKAIEIVVSDRGPGLPKDEEGKIFEKFYRAAKGRGGGVGLGLTICKGIITAHGGKIWARTRDDDGGGAAFHFTLPIEGEPPLLVDTAAASTSGSS